MRNRFDRQLEQLNNELINMGSLIEEAIEMAITALMKQMQRKQRKLWISMKKLMKKKEKSRVFA